MDDPTHERSGPPPTRDALIHMSPRIWIRRAYEPPSLVDGHRVLVDRLWPRGISKTELRIDTWARDVAPSDELRRWFGRARDTMNEFRTRYRRELEAHTGAAAVEFAALVDRVAARGQRHARVRCPRQAAQQRGRVAREVLEERTSSPTKASTSRASGE